MLMYISCHFRKLKWTKVGAIHVTWTQSDRDEQKVVDGLCYILSTLTEQHWPDGQSSLISHLLVLLINFFVATNINCQKWDLHTWYQDIFCSKATRMPSAQTSVISCKKCCSKLLMWLILIDTMLDVPSLLPNPGCSWLMQLIIHVHPYLPWCTDLMLASLMVQPPTLVSPCHGSMIHQQTSLTSSDALEPNPQLNSEYPPVFTRRSHHMMVAIKFKGDDTQQSWGKQWKTKVTPGVPI